jgi:hypothetical protein
MLSLASCLRCGRDIVPRLITGPRIFPGRNWTPIPLRSVCPFCASTYASFYSPARDLCGRLIVLLGLLVLVAVGVRLLAQVLVTTYGHGHSGTSSSSYSSSPSALPKKH